MRITREKEPWNRTTKQKGRVIRETSTQLPNLKTLGDDSEILVLREVVEDDKPAEPTAEVEPTEPIVVPDINASLEQEHEALTPEEIRDRLESMRPRSQAEPGEPHYITATKFKKLAKALKHDFNQSQLSRYYADVKSIRHQTYNKTLINDLKKKTSTSSSLLTRTEWQPGARPISVRLPGVDVTTRPRRMPVSKQLLVDRIIRDVWNLVPLEEVEAPGEIELSLKPWHITLLKSGDETILDKISKERRARLEIHQPHCVLRITADKSTAEYAANDIQEALEGIVTEKLPLKSWVPCLVEERVPNNKRFAALYTQEHLDTVMSLTRTSIQSSDTATAVRHTQPHELYYVNNFSSRFGV